MQRTRSTAATDGASGSRQGKAQPSRTRKGERAMDGDVINGQWKQLKGKAQQRWGKLSDSDWDRIEGQREQLVGRLQELYGKQRDEAEREVDEWGRGLH